MRREYLFMYNMVQWGGWLMIFADLALNLSVTPYATTLVYAFQHLAILEIVHAIVGLVRASPVTTGIQVLGRLQVLFIHSKILEAQQSSGNLPMISAWCFVEIVRYLYLALNLIGFAPFPLLWLRYSLFYILYPIGVYGEMKVLYDALPGIDNAGLGSISLPNNLNFEFSLGTYVRIFLVVAYLPGLFNQYTYMIKQRRVVLEKARAVKSE
jgi:very-long-chain (3R)-3-hydroxyacyl-CoA dehydratase